MPEVIVIAGAAIGAVWHRQHGVILSGPDPTIGWYEVEVELDGQKCILHLYPDEFRHV